MVLKVLDLRVPLYHKNYCGPQRAFVHVGFIYQYFPFFRDTDVENKRVDTKGGKWRWGEVVVVG